MVTSNGTTPRLLRPMSLPLRGRMSGMGQYERWSDALQVPYLHLATPIVPSVNAFVRPQRWQSGRLFFFILFHRVFCLLLTFLAARSGCDLGSARNVDNCRRA
ncbi:unnamed protein product [Ixodes pacificus]